MLRALEPDRHDRWPDIGSFVAALHRAVPEAPVRSKSPEPATLLQNPRRPESAAQRRLSGPMWALVCLLVFAVAFAATYAVATRVL